MKNLFSSILALTMGVTASVAQIPGMMSMPSAQPLEGTSLGANETVAYDGIALGNRVKLRGYVDFIYGYDDNGSNDNSAFSATADIDFLVDFSPVTGEVHLNVSDANSLNLEQAFGRYSFNQDFNLSFGRQLTNLGYEADEAPGLYAVTNAYSYKQASDKNATLRRNYVDGIRANFNNGQFGLSLGLHDDYFGVDDAFNDNIAIDIAASVMIVPGLEARLGFAHQDQEHANDDNINQFNAWLAYNPGDLTLALEFDIFDVYGDEIWDFMFLANYQFVDWFGATFRYSHEDLDPFVGADSDADRFTLALLFSLTQNLFLNVEYSHTALDPDDVDEFYIEGLFTF
jgi:hypothetical protein